MRKAGDLHYLPARASGLLPDRDSHPHAILFDERPPAVPAVVFGTKSPKEARKGASHVTVAPRPRPQINPNGLNFTTYFYPGVIYRPSSQELGATAGSVAVNLRAIRAAMRDALGIGKGRSGDTGVAAGSLRGTILRLDKVRCQALRTEWAVSLTEHTYSAEHHYHALIPVYESDGGADGNGIIYSVGESWVPRIFPDHKSARFLAPLVHSVWCPYAVKCETGVVVDSDTLSRLEDAVCTFLEC